MKRLHKVMFLLLGILALASCSKDADLATIQTNPDIHTIDIEWRSNKLLIDFDANQDFTLSSTKAYPAIFQLISEDRFLSTMYNDSFCGNGRDYYYGTYRFIGAQQISLQLDSLDNDFGKTYYHEPEQHYDITTISDKLILTKAH